VSVLTGYGRGGWNSGPYGQTDTSVSVTGVSGTGSVNSVAVSSAGEVAVTGVAATSAVGSVTVTAGTSVSVSVTGVSATGAIGSVTVTEGSGITVSATGVSATGSIGSVTIGIDSIISATGVSATGSVGSVTIGIGSTISATGVAATSSIGNVNVKFGATISATGVAATGEIQGVLIWGLVDDSQSITYSAVNDSQTITWSNVNDSQTITYSNVNTNPVITFTVTVYPKTGGGNAFYIDGVERPVLTLIEGNTYRFDTSNSTTALHPLRLSTTSDGTHAGGSIYSDNVTIVGTQGQSGSYLQIVVASSTPTLHYFCTVHSGMGNQINTPVLYTDVTLNENSNWQEIAA